MRVRWGFVFTVNMRFSLYKKQPGNSPGNRGTPAVDHVVQERNRHVQIKVAKDSTKRATN